MQHKIELLQEKGSEVSAVCLKLRDVAKGKNKVDEGANISTSLSCFVVNPGTYERER